MDKKTKPKRLKDAHNQYKKLFNEVTKGVKGLGMNYNPSEYNLIPVYDMSKGFRMINASTITELKIEGINYKVAE